MLGTRPDIAFAVSQVSQHNSLPDQTHERAVHRILRYLHKTTNLGITYDGSKGLTLEAYSDADHGAGEDRKSISGYLFKIGGGAIAWTSKKQPTVALSSIEAEYMALLQALKQLI